MTRRTGIPTLMGLGEKLCKFIVAFTPTIRTFTNNDPAVMAALATALAACEVLHQELANYRELGD